MVGAEEAIPLVVAAVKTALPPARARTICDRVEVVVCSFGLGGADDTRGTGNLQHLFTVLLKAYTLPVHSYNPTVQCAHVSSSQL